MEPERRLWDSELSALWVHCNRRVSLAGWVYYSTDGGQALSVTAREYGERREHGAVLHAARLPTRCATGLSAVWVVGL